MKTALAVDGHSLAWRCYHAGGEMSAPDGSPTGMIFKFIRSLRASLDLVEADTCRVAWDWGRPAFRLQAYPDYKRKRKPKDTELLTRFKVQQAWLDVTLPHLGVSCESCQGWEADDVISALVQRACRTTAFDRIIILSSDRDMWQLVSRRVLVLIPGKEELLGLDNFSEMTAFESPMRWFWYRVLTGDASDGIPGVPKIGTVRGRRLIDAGWPHKGSVQAALGEPDAAWHKTNDAVVRRNQTLMDLGISGNKLDLAIGKAEAHPLVRPARRDLEVAKAAVKQALYGTRPYATGQADMLDALRKKTDEVNSQLLAQWGEWSAPFRRLR